MEANWLESSELENRLDPYRYSPVFMQAVHTLKSSPHPIANLDSARDPKEPINYGILQPREFLRQGGVPMVRAVDLGNPFVDAAGVARVPADVEAPYRRSRLQSGDVLLSIAGTLGAIGICPAGWSIANVNQSVARLRVNEYHDPYYLTAFLMTRIGQTLLMREAVGSVQRHFNLEDIPSVLFPSPGSNIERAIGSKLRQAERLRELAGRTRDLAQRAVDDAFGPIEWIAEHSFGWIPPERFEDSRLDAWFNQPVYLRMTDCLGNRAALSPVSKFASLSTALADLRSMQTNHFDYYEIADVDSDSGLISSTPVAVQDAPSRAKYAVKPGDVLISTVRPNRKGIAIVPDNVVAAVCSSGFSVLRAPDAETAHYLRACLTHDIATHQLMRWNTGATYPAIERSVPLSVLIPDPGSERIQELGSMLRGCAQDLGEAQTLIKLARCDVEELISGTLDEAALLDDNEGIEEWLKRHPSPSAQRRP